MESRLVTATSLWNKYIRVSHAKWCWLKFFTNHPQPPVRQSALSSHVRSWRRPLQAVCAGRCASSTPCSRSGLCTKPTAPKLKHVCSVTTEELLQIKWTAGTYLQQCHFLMLLRKVGLSRKGLSLQQISFHNEIVVKLFVNKDCRNWHLTTNV